MKNPLACTKCEYAVTGKETKCPQCGGWIRRAQRIRTRGGILIVLGLILVAMMGTITIMLAPMMLAAKETTGARFTGTPQQGMLILGFFGIIIVFGLACIAGGVFQLLTGRRSILIIVLVLGLAFLLWVLANAVKTALQRTSTQARTVTVAQLVMRGRLLNQNSVNKT